MNHNSQIYTSDAGSVTLNEKHRFFGLHTYSRTNIRPVSPTCRDWRIEKGIRIGTWVFAVRRTKRQHDDFPNEVLATPL